VSDEYTPRHMAPAPPRRRRGVLAAVVGIIVTAGALVGTVVLEGEEGGDEATTSVEDVVPMVERPALPEAEGEGAPTFAVPVPLPITPERVLIPAIGVDSELEDLALQDDGRLAPPQDFARAGWFTAGTQPGQRGPAGSPGSTRWSRARRCWSSASTAAGSPSR